MSIIHDALKKVQQGLSHKTNGTPPPAAPPSVTTPKASAYVYDTPSEVENLPPSGNPKVPLINRMKSVLAFLCAMAITAGALWYCSLQFKNQIPKFRHLITLSVSKLIHQLSISDFLHKKQKPVGLQSMAQITISHPVPINQLSEIKQSGQAVASKPVIPLVMPSSTKISQSANTSPMGSIPKSADSAVIIAPEPVDHETLDIHGVMSNGATNLVLINDQVYQEGDDVDGVKILKITLNYIVVDNNGKEEKIRVKN